MRQNPNSRRSRGRGGRKPGNSRNQIFDSNGPGARVRGNSAQIYEKYQQLARDASSSGDRVAAENFYQHAEHYYRLMEAAGLNRNANGQDEAQQRGDNGGRNAEAAEASTPNSDAPAERTNRSGETRAEDGAGASDRSAPQNANGNGEAEPKPARRAGGRRSNGSANGGAAPDKEAESALSEEDGSEPASEDTNPASA